MGDEHVPTAVGTSVDQASVRLGAELLRIRKEVLKLSQDKMARRLGVAGYSQQSRTVSTPRATVSNFERGTRAPADDVLARYLALSDDPEATAELMVFLLPPPPTSPPPMAAESSGDPVADTNADLRAPGSPRRRLPMAAIALAAVAALSAAALIVVVSQDDDGDRARRQVPSQTWTETTGTPAHTWSDYEQASGTAGTPLGPRQSVQVSCRVRGFVVPDGDPWWYRLESPPWSGRFYATSDAFYNQGSVGGPVDNGVIVDEQVPLC